MFDWLSFFDIDEFLEINKKYDKIQDFLKDRIFVHCQNIKINWLLYYDENLLYYENKPVQERIKFFRYDNKLNIHVKSTVKGNLPINFWEKAKNPHTSLLNFTCCSSSGKLIQFGAPSNEPPDYTNAKLKHYRYKSFEEYCLKIKRGRADLKYNINKKMIKEYYKKLYFLNKNNPKKMKIIEEIFSH